MSPGLQWRPEPRPTGREIRGVTPQEVACWIAVLAELGLVVRRFSGEAPTTRELRRAMACTLGLDRVLYDAETHEELGPATYQQAYSSAEAADDDGPGVIWVQLLDGRRPCYVAA